MLKKRSETPDIKAQQEIKNAVPTWISILSISITAFIVGFILMRI